MAEMRTKLSQIENSFGLSGTLWNNRNLLQHLDYVLYFRPIIKPFLWVLRTTVI